MSKQYAERIRRPDAPEPTAVAPATRGTLTVGAVDDPAEREADAVADLVVTGQSISAGPFGAPSAVSRISRATATIGTAEPAGPDGGPVSADVERRIHRSSGRPLAPDVRGEMESAFGTDLGTVRVHTGPAADALNRDLSARAFTTGQDVFFAAGEYQPHTSAGRHVLAHELTHTIQQRGPAAVQRIQRRAAMTTAQIMTALNKIDFVKARLQTTLHGSTMQDRVTAMLDSWNAHAAKATNNDLDLQDAMMLSTALDGVARVIAEELNDVSVQPLVSQKLFELYRTQIGSKIKRQNKDVAGATRKKVLDLAGALAADDPVTRYVHREISLRNAAASIASMATNAQAADPFMTPLKVFGLMEQRFQVKMAAYKKDQLHKDDQAERFSARESPGEYSSYFFAKMFGANAFANADTLGWQQQQQGKADRLAMTNEAEAMLAALRQEVAKPTIEAAVVPRAGLTEGQERHLQSIEQAEQAIDLTSVQSEFETFFQQRYALTKGPAAALYTDVVNFLGSAPLTITVSAKQWFGGANAPDPNFRPSSGKVATTKVSKAFGKRRAKGSIEHLPTWNDEGLAKEAQRGAKYLRFRKWKDELMSGLNELGPEEQAVFGALNVNFDLSKGSDAVAQHGQNYYGDLHYVLRRERVRDRMIYTATDHGQHRRDPLLALHDFTFGGRGITWLKDTKKLTMIDNIVNAVRSKVPLYGLPLLFEIQIFGGVNVKDDVREVHLGQAVTPDLEAAVRTFYTTHKKVKVVKAGAAPANAVQTDGTVDEVLMNELVASTMLPANAKQDVQTDMSTSTMTGNEQKMLERLLTVARYIKETATADPTSLTVGDVDNLRACLARIKGPADFLKMMNKAKAAELALLDTRLQEADQAIKTADAAVKHQALRNARRGKLRQPVGATV